MAQYKTPGCHSSILTTFQDTLGKFESLVNSGKAGAHYDVRKVIMERDFYAGFGGGHDGGGGGYRRPFGRSQ